MFSENICSNGVRKKLYYGKGSNVWVKYPSIVLVICSGAWIITGGAHAGVMEQVGEAVKDLGNASSIRPVVTIGIVPKGLEVRLNYIPDSFFKS